MKTIKRLLILSVGLCACIIMLSGNCSPNNSSSTPVTPKPPVVKHYRLKQIDKDGNVKYSNEIIIKQ